MERTSTSLLFLLSLLIIFASAVNQIRAQTCDENLSSCENCDQRCKAKHGPSSVSKCNGPDGTCGCASFKPAKLCIGATDMCTDKCPTSCCDRQCAIKYKNGKGGCVDYAGYRMCICEYTC
ncbi:low-molecular-weight cysteine-rich 57 [Arabidopsis thaliana]|uniref:Putative defensin-like protein 179 n=1 Tax=Arabidopsis thaliana TaxID=3702 RepID=DF179_ARATH|nr:low-molecular-weight cysteine-rich 57 [Arabidopsis thaliana]P82771.1 RecName: Full=Putative defensin-like protein 179; AltName: Full=Putative low-molecular-weight cysteine-rich protein 57; Short=Protein LCR57; Flags: Precursor [Arabidopsis thaliana]AED94787.1 low-molecular-weight cysteine-rich 57 [Arabidopsis thaliana]|eukprot:NP_001031996.1 low-molecular-weight cysteine-rich 57 [Arabidopsis thaliana]